MAYFLPLLILSVIAGASASNLDYAEATIADIQAYFNDGSLTSRQLVEYYISRIKSLNPHLHAIIEVNPDALRLANRADLQRRSGGRPRGTLHGIPILLMDDIATRDRLNTTSGSFALLGSVVPRDAGVVRLLRAAGAIILGKASMSEWRNFRDYLSNGWSARGGEGINPYSPKVDPCGASSGSAIAVAAGMVAVALGTDSDSSILCPSIANSVVGIKPTVGLTSRSGVVPISPRKDTVGPIGRTVADAVAVLEAIVGYDERDAEATAAAARFVPEGGYQQFLNAEGLKGKRLGILRGYFQPKKTSILEKVYSAHFQIMKEKGAILLDNLDIQNEKYYWFENGEGDLLLAEFKLSLNKYLSELIVSPVRSLADVISFNNNHSNEEKLAEYNQYNFLNAEKTNGLGEVEREVIKRLTKISMEELERLMKENNLDSFITPNSICSQFLAIGGHPGIVVPSGYLNIHGNPFGICFGGLKGSEPKLIEIAYAYEQATKARKPPPLEKM